MRSRVIVAVSSVFVLVLALCAAPPASADNPWPTGTVFVAAQGPRYRDGGEFYTPPGSNLRYTLYNGTVEDTVVTADGTVYWTTCNGSVYKYNPASTETLVRSGLNCADGIAVESNGNIVVSDFYDIYVLSPTGTTLSTISTQNVARSIAVDPSGAIYFIDGSDYLEVLPAGASTPVRVMGIPYQGSYGSVRLGANSTLVLSLVASPGGALVLSLGSGTTTNRTTGASSYGAVSDPSGNLYASDLVDDVSTIDQVDKFPAGGGPATLVANGYDEPQGLAVWPPVAPGTRAASTTALTTSTTSAAAYDQVRLTAHVASGANAPRGFVQFASNGQPLGDAVPVTNGIARLSARLPKGSDVVTATYAGSSTYEPSQSAGTAITVHGVRTSTVLTTSDPTSNPDGTTVDVTATVSSTHGTPDGYVKFFANNALVDSEPLDGSGAASASVTATGLHTTVTAVYDGSSEFNGSTSEPLTLTATAPYLPKLTTSVTYGAYHPNGTEKITISARISGYGSVGRPGGSITADNGFHCTPLKNGPGATLALSTCTANLASGGYDVTTTYSGDANYASASTDDSIYPGG